MSPQTMVEKMVYERLVKSFMHVIVLRELAKGTHIGGHDIRALIYKRFHILISSGIIYPLLYSMERNRLIEGMTTTKKRKRRVYGLTERGKERLENISEINDKILSFMKSILGK